MVIRECKRLVDELCLRDLKCLEITNDTNKRISRMLNRNRIRAIRPFVKFVIKTARNRPTSWKTPRNQSVMSWVNNQYDGSFEYFHARYQRPSIMEVGSHPSGRDDKNGDPCHSPPSQPLHPLDRIRILRRLVEPDPNEPREPERIS